MPTWGFKSQVPDDNDDLFFLAKIGVDAIKSVNNTVYKIGSPANALG